MKLKPVACHNYYVFPRCLYRPIIRNLLEISLALYRPLYLLSIYVLFSLFLFGIIGVKHFRHLTVPVIFALFIWTTKSQGTNARTLEGPRNHIHWRPYYADARRKGYPNRGWARYAKKVEKIAKNREKGNPNRYDQSCGHAIKPGKGRKYKTTCTLISTSNERQETSELKLQISSKHKKCVN